MVDIATGTELDFEYDQRLKAVKLSNLAYYVEKSHNADYFGLIELQYQEMKIDL